MKSFPLFTAIIFFGVLGAASPKLLAHESDQISVRDAGAMGDGKTDDTQAFLKAVATAKTEGKSVYVPRGTYLISQPIDLENISLSGPPGGAWPADNDVLPVIIPAHCNGPAFHLGAAAGLHWIDITYHWDAKPTEGPPAILVSGNGVYISNLRIRYAWDGILTDGKNNVGRANFENIFMVSIHNIGVRVTGTWDVSRLSNIEVWNADAGSSVPDRGIGFLLGKNDLIRMSDCFVFGMACGYRMQDKITGCPIVGGTWGVMNGCSCDFCAKGIDIQGENNLSIAGGTFWDHEDGLTIDGAGARVRVSACEFKSNGAPALVIRNCDHAVITGCSLSRPMTEHPGLAVTLLGGHVVLGSNHIDSTGGGIHVGPHIKSAVITGNDINATPAMIDAHGPQSKIQLKDNAIEENPNHQPSR